MLAFSIMSVRSPTSGRPPDPRKRAAILSAAQRLFASRGFSATSMDAVAKVAGTSKLTAYRHFGSKDDLFAAAIAARCADMLADSSSPEDPDLHSPRAALIAFGKAFLRLILHPDALSIHRLIIAEKDRAPQLGPLFHAAAILPTQQRLAHLLARLNLPVGDTMLAATDLLALWRSKPMIPIEMGITPLTGEELDAQVVRAVDLCLAAWSHQQV